MQTLPVIARNLIPRGLPQAVALLLALLFVGVAWLRLSGVSIREPDAAAVTVRELRFEDTADGSVAVIDGKTGALIENVRGEQGFLRGTLRGLARERKRSGFGPEASFQLIGRADGRLTLADPATGQRIDLESFGPTNAAVFARWLP